MTIVLAPDSFKGSLSAVEVCGALERGIRRVLGDVAIISKPMADGGEGTVDCLVAGTAGRFFEVEVMGPLGTPVRAAYGLLGELAGGSTEATAVIEMAAAAGLGLVSEDQRNPLHTTTFGLGQLIRHALDAGCRRFIIGIGGSATTDGGAGMVQALGARFYDAQGVEITAPLTGGLIGSVVTVDVSAMPAALQGCEFLVACDVDNPLLGQHGAARVYGPQKGADAEAVEILERNLGYFYDVAEAACGQVVRDCAGAGAAGGLGAGLMLFVQGRLQSGIEMVLDYCGFDACLADAQWVLTGEGRIDDQTARGKTIAGVAQRCRKADVPVIAVAGSLGLGYQAVYDLGIKAVMPICSGPMTLDHAMTHAGELLADTAERVLRLIATRNGG